MSWLTPQKHCSGPTPAPSSSPHVAWPPENLSFQRSIPCALGLSAALLGACAGNRADPTGVGPLYNDALHPSTGLLPGYKTTRVLTSLPILSASGSSLTNFTITWPPHYSTTGFFLERRSSHANAHMPTCPHAHTARPVLVLWGFEISQIHLTKQGIVTSQGSG